VKFADAELLGIPHRIVVSDRGIDAGTVSSTVTAAPARTRTGRSAKCSSACAPPGASRPAKSSGDTRRLPLRATALTAELARQALAAGVETIDDASATPRSLPEAFPPTA
jgi:hypothetical protein